MDTSTNIEIKLSDGQTIWIYDYDQGLEIAYSQSYDAIYVDRKDIPKLIQELQALV